jgi:hypothetical protein
VPSDGEEIVHEAMQIVKPFLADHGFEVLDPPYEGYTFVWVRGKRCKAFAYKYIVRVAGSWSPSAATESMAYVPSAASIVVYFDNRMGIIDLHDPDSLESLLQILRHKHHIYHV